MSLQITNNAGILEVNGSLNAQNTGSLQNYFEALIQQSNFITLSLNSIIDFDKTVFQAIISLYKKALAKNKVFYIIGKENQKVADLFESEKFIYLLKSNAA